MDLWVVGAATAAGYIAKYWKNHSRDRDGLSEFSSGFLMNEKSETPIHRLTQRKTVVEDASTNVQQSEIASEAEAASTSGYSEKIGSFGAYEDCDLLSLSRLPLGFSAIQNVKENESKKESNGLVCDDSCEPCVSQMDSVNGSRRTRASLRIKHSSGQFIRPFSALESCLMAQLYKEHTNMQDYVLSTLPTPSTTMRPLLVTDGNQIISRAYDESFSTWIGTDDNGLQKDDNVYGVPSLPKVRNLDLSKKIKSRMQKGCNERTGSSSKLGSRKHFRMQNGPDEGIVLFFLGISFGIVSSLIANRTEVDKLKEILKHTENLVQDLQEELEMKDSLTVKELANDNYDSQDTCQSSFYNREPFFPMQNVDNSTNNNSTSFNEKADETSEFMNKIEAELEAELERLGLNMHASTTERRLTDLVELDPDFAADFAQGELRVDMVNQVDVAQSESNRDASGTATTHSGNYAVSPRELSLRLHKVIESRLEERVKELETALQNSQRKVQIMESEKKNSISKLWSSELRYSSGEESPIVERSSNTMPQPLVMNLSGEALDAYNEAYEELMKINESEEEDSPPEPCEHQVDMHPYEHSALHDQNGRANCSLESLLQPMHIIEETPNELFISRSTEFVEHDSTVQDLIFDSVSDHESHDCDDEVEKQLIKQIVEKTKKGSPVVLNAQRVFFSMDENEQ